MAAVGDHHGSRAHEYSQLRPSPLTLSHAQSSKQALLDKCGFEILRSKHFSLRDNPQGFAVSLAPLLNPTGRRIRQVPETPRLSLWKDLAFLGLIAASVPFTLLEAACRAGSTVMIEARKE